ncbi:MAG: HAMP domain-containing protein [Alphaproteobacteria bacterium]|nr:HAMP domain-containing protein [Alphaproteobacteria bacterium]
MWRHVKRLLPKTLLARSLLIIVMPLIVIQVVMAFFFYNAHWYLVNTRIAEAIAGDIAVIAQQFSDFPGGENQAWMMTQSQERMGMQVLYRDGETISDEPAFVSKWSAPYFLTAALDKLLPPPYRIDGQRYPREVFVDVQAPAGTIRIVVPETRFATSNTYIFVLWMGATSLILFLVATAFMGTQTRPIRRLARAADAFGKGRDVPGFTPSGAAEVRQAAAAFLTMRERIRRQMSQRVEMLAGVSHDLRTPLTRLKLQLAMLSQSPEVEALKHDVDEMETMLEGYLAFARGEGAEASEDTDLAEILREVVNDARREGSQIRLVTDSSIVLPVRPVAIKRSVTNLVTNAQRHAKHVEIEAGRHNGAVEITIDDDGPGIPEEEYEGVFKPFYRLEPSRNRETGGTGLGLTIARDVIRGHGGDIRLGKSPLGGLRAQLTLPL